MSVRVLTYDDVERLLPMGECIDLMHDTLARLARGEGYQPLRSITFPPDAGGGIGLMPAWRGGERPTYALKAINVVPDNPRARGLDTHQGAVLVSNGVTGELEGVLNAAAITEIRTAAVSGAATRALARDDARVVGMLGAGAQARGHLHAMAAARPFEHGRIWGRDPEQARRLADELELPVPARGRRACRGRRARCRRRRHHDGRRDADRPARLVRRRHAHQRGRLEHPAHARARRRDGRGVDALRRPARVDRERGRRLPARGQGGRGRPGPHRGRAGRGVRRHAPGPHHGDEITLFKSLGIAMEDLAAGEYVLRKAQEQGVGSEVPF